MRTVQIIPDYTPEAEAALKQNVDLNNLIESPAVVRPINYYVLRKSKCVDDTTQSLHVNRMTTTPDVLKAVGLCRIPKTYSKKEITMANIDRSKTSCKLVFCTNSGFGHIAFEM